MELSNPAELLQQLIRCRSVTPEDDGAQDSLRKMLEALGFKIERVTFRQEGTADIANLYARLGDDHPHLMFAGHTDVVPAGDESAWTHPPFSAEIREGTLFGRGAVDMKGGIACFLAAVARYLEKAGKLTGSISMVITGDEEGPSINGTDKLLKWAVEKGETWDAAIVGEPTNPGQVGDAVKIGRRGSLSGKITVTGVQGHSAYPHLADNPITALMDLLDGLLIPAFDEGTEDFEASNLQITSIDVGNPATNVIPRQASAVFNIRFNDLWDGDSLKLEIERRLRERAEFGRYRQERQNPARYKVEWIGRVSPAFLTRDEVLIENFASAAEEVTGRRPELSTGGGTSDARFVKDYCPVIEFGLVGKTMHQVDERISLDELENLTRIYLKFLENWFSKNGQENRTS